MENYPSPLLKLDAGWYMPPIEFCDEGMDFERPGFLKAFSSCYCTCFGNASNRSDVQTPLCNFLSFYFFKFSPS